MRGILTRITENLLEDSGNVIILRFRGIFEKIPANVIEGSGDSGEY